MTIESALTKPQAAERFVKLIDDFCNQTVSPLGSAIGFDSAGNPECGPSISLDIGFDCDDHHDESGVSCPENWTATYIESEVLDGLDSDDITFAS